MAFDGIKPFFNFTRLIKLPAQIKYHPILNIDDH